MFSSETGEWGASILMLPSLLIARFYCQSGVLTTFLPTMGKMGYMPCDMQYNGRVFSSTDSESKGPSTYASIIGRLDNAGADVVAWKGTTDGSFSVALNCDAAVIQLGNQSTCGRVIRDHNVAFLCSFHAKIGSCSVIYAELWPFSWASNWLGLVGLRFVLIQSR
ncbi:hypothetical protein JHK82_026070 [Glycine max]|nr:hypothetical protein JHK82_026070 [Glycine max]